MNEETWLCVCEREKRTTSNNHTVAFQTHITYTELENMYINWFKLLYNQLVFFFSWKFTEKWSLPKGDLINSWPEKFAAEICFLLTNKYDLFQNVNAEYWKIVDIVRIWKRIFLRFWKKKSIVPFWELVMPWSPSQHSEMDNTEVMLSYTWEMMLALGSESSGSHHLQVMWPWTSDLTLLVLSCPSLAPPPFTHSNNSVNNEDDDICSLFEAS